MNTRPVDAHVRQAWGAAAVLNHAAAPSFALLALLNAVTEAGPEMLCGGGAPFAKFAGGMTAMYALMALFHLAPWLRLLERRRHAQPQKVTAP